MSLFFLTPLQEKTFRHLSDEPYSVSDIAILAKLPRTSVAKALIFLEERGLVRSRKLREKNKHVYIRVSDEEINVKIEELRSAIFEKPFIDRKTVLTSSSSNDGVHVYKGVESVKEAILQLSELRMNEKVYIYMGSRAVKHLVTLFGKEFFVTMQAAAVAKQFLAVSFRSHLTKQAVSQDKDIKESYKGRVSLFYALPESSFSEHSIMYAFRDSILFINLKDVSAFHIRDKEYFQVITKMLHLIQDISQREIAE